MSLDVLPQWTAVNNWIRKADQKRPLILDQSLNRNLLYFTLWCFAVLSNLPPPNSRSINFWSRCHQRQRYHLCSLPLSAFSCCPETSQQKKWQPGQACIGTVCYQSRSGELSDHKRRQNKFKITLAQSRSWLKKCCWGRQGRGDIKLC